MLQTTSRKKIAACLVIYFAFCTAISGYGLEAQSQISYFLQRRQFPAALWAYQQQAYLAKRHDPVAIEKIATAIVNEGIESSDINTRLVAYYSMIACNYIPNLQQLKSAMQTTHPGLQLAAIYLLKQHTGDRSEEVLRQGLLSPFPIIQLTTAYAIAQKKFPKAYALLESLLYKTPKSLHIYFPEFFATLDTVESRRKVLHFINDGDEKIRIAAIISAMQHKIEEALPYFRTILTHANPLEQEACLFGLSHMNDTASLSRMKNLTMSACDEVAIASSFALYSLGHHEYYTTLVKFAENGNLFAISLLGTVPEGTNSLYELLKNPNFTIRINAALSLLQLRDNKCLPVIMEILQAGYHGMVFCQVTSQGGCMHYIKPQASLPTKIESLALKSKQDSAVILENLILQLSELTETNFLSVAQFLLESNYSSLIPLTVQLLENLHTPEAISILESGVSKLGCPLIRGYSQIALFKLGRCPLSRSFHQFLENSLRLSLVNYEEIRNKKNIGIFTLKPEETLRLVLTCMQAIASESCESSIDLLLQATRNSHELNRYILAGLLLQCIQ